MLIALLYSALVLLLSYLFEKKKKQDRQADVVKRYFDTLADPVRSTQMLLEVAGTDAGFRRNLLLLVSKPARRACSVVRIDLKNRSVIELHPATMLIATHTMLHMQGWTHPPSCEWCFMPKSLFVVIAMLFVTADCDCLGHFDAIQRKYAHALYTAVHQHDRPLNADEVARLFDAMMHLSIQIYFRDQLPPEKLVEIVTNVFDVLIHS
jgi:hypothetical protein